MVGVFYYYYFVQFSNVTPVAEFNFHACPHSVHTMLQATACEDPAKAIKLYMLPTDGK